MSMATKYALMKRAKKTGECMGPDCAGCSSPKCMAGGGFVGEEMQSGYEGDPMAQDESSPSAEDEDQDMVGRIMKQHFSKGGMVANKTDQMADSEPAEFDELAKDDTQEGDYVDDGPGDEREEEDERDVVARIMRSRKKTDRMPRPA